MITTITKGNAESKGFIAPLRFSPLLRKSRQKPQGNAAFWLALPGLFGKFSYTTQALLPRNGSAHSGLKPFFINHLIRKMPPQTCPEAGLMVVISQLRVCLPKIF